MPFVSINPINPRTNPWNFGRNCSAFGDVEKLSSLSRPFWFFFCFIHMKISPKLCVRMDWTQFLILWWFTAKNERGKDKIAWVYVLFSVTQVYKETQWLEIVIKSKIKFSFHKITYFQRRFNPYMQLPLLQRQTKTPKTISNVFKCCLIKSNCLPT